MSSAVFIIFHSGVKEHKVYSQNLKKIHILMMEGACFHGVNLVESPRAIE